jgi:hypothetical protein
MARKARVEYEEPPITFSTVETVERPSSGM